MARTRTEASPLLFTLEMILAVSLMIPQIAPCVESGETVQGSETIKGIEGALDSSVASIEQGQYGVADSLVSQMADEWHAFVDREQLMFSGEIERSQDLDILISAISATFEEISAVSCRENADMMMDRLKDLGGQMEEAFTAVSKPVVLVFIGPKCRSWPNCKAGQRTMANVTDVAGKFIGKVRISVINAQSERYLAQKYKIMLVPTLVFLARNGEEIDRKSGEVTDFVMEDELMELISE